MSNRHVCGRPDKKDRFKIISIQVLYLISDVNFSEFEIPRDMASKRQLPSPVVSTGQKSKFLPKIKAETLSMSKERLSKTVGDLNFCGKNLMKIISNLTDSTEFPFSFSLCNPAKKLKLP